MDADEIRTNALSERVIGCPFRVLNTLGTGFPGKVQENTLAHELPAAGFPVAQQQGITVCSKGIPADDSIAGLVIEATVVIEPQASKALHPVHTAQCINCLKATGLHLCLLPSRCRACKATALPTKFESARVHLRPSAANSLGRPRSPAAAIAAPQPLAASNRRPGQYRGPSQKRPRGW